MSCECYQIDGRFIAEDPDCPAHGREAQQREQEREEEMAKLRAAAFDPSKLKIELEIDKPFPVNNVIRVILKYNGERISEDSIELPYIG